MKSHSTALVNVEKLVSVGDATQCSAPGGKISIPVCFWFQTDSAWFCFEPSKHQPKISRRFVCVHPLFRIWKSRCSVAVQGIYFCLTLGISFSLFVIFEKVCERKEISFRGISKVRNEIFDIRS